MRLQERARERVQGRPVRSQHDAGVLLQRARLLQHGRRQQQQQPHPDNHDSVVDQLLGFCPRLNIMILIFCTTEKH